MNAETDRSRHGLQQPQSEEVLSFPTLETWLLPPERFKPRERIGDVVDIRKIGNTVALLEKVQDHYEGATYDAKGNVARVVLDPSSQDLVKGTKKENIVLADLGTGLWPPNGVAEESLLKKMGYSSKVDDHLLKDWKTRSRTYFAVGQHRFTNPYGQEVKGQKYIEKNEINSKPPLFLNAGDWKLTVRENKRKGKTFVFAVGDNYFELLPQSPINYKRIEINEPLKNENILQAEGFEVRKSNGVFNIVDRTGKVLETHSGKDLTIDPANSNLLYFVDNGKVYKINLNTVATKTTPPVLEEQIKAEDVQEIDFDPNGNYLVIRSGDNKLTIVDKETGIAERAFDGVKGPVLVDSQGNILYLDTQGRLREINTNFLSIPKATSETARQVRQDALRKVRERFANLQLDAVKKPEVAAISRDEVADTLRQTISKQVTERINTATAPEAVENVLDSLHALKTDPANRAYSTVIDEFINQARGKLSEIKVAQLDTQLTSYQATLDEVKSVGDTLDLDQQLAKLLDLRQKTDITDPLKRREIDQRLQALQDHKDTITNHYQEELVNASRQTLPQIEQLIGETGSREELDQFSTTVSARQFETMLSNIKDPQVRREFRDGYNKIKAEHSTKLESRIKEIEQKNRQVWAQVVQESREDLAGLQEHILQFSNIQEIDRFDRNPLITAWRVKIFTLPPDLREIEEQKLQSLLTSRKKDIEHRRDLGALTDIGELKFGNATFPIFKDPPRIWQVKLTPRKAGFSGLADLTFEDIQGRIWRPEEEHDLVVANDMNDERTKTLIEYYRKRADEYFKGVKREVPEFNEHWRLTDFHMQKLDELVESLNIQTANHMGITVLEGETGTGKTVLADILANLSNREVITIGCNQNTVKEDLSYEFYYDPDKGTYKLPSRLLEGLQKSGSIILFEEINTLKPGVVKMLNPLFDHKRRLYTSEAGRRGEILADPTVIFMATMNPQDYAGVEHLAETIVGRADIISVGYPPFEELRNGRTYFRSDEAEILASYVKGLDQLTQKEFKQCWDYVINRDTNNGADILVQGNPDIESNSRRLQETLRVANHLRRMYESYQLGSSNEPLDFVTSIRETINIALRMNHNQGTKDIIERVILPKIGDRRQRDMVRKTITGVLPE